MRKLVVVISLLVAAPALAGTPARLAVVSSSFGGDPVDGAALDAALASRTTAAAACGTSAALVYLGIDKAGKVSRALAGGSGDAKIDRCLEAALRPAVFPKSSRGGAVVVRYEPPAP